MKPTHARMMIVHLDTDLTMTIDRVPGAFRYTMSAPGMKTHVADLNTFKEAYDAMMFQIRADMEGDLNPEG